MTLKKTAFRTASPQQPVPRLLRRPEVEAITGLSRSTIYALIAKDVSVRSDRSAAM
ncbi:helix-turn-helix transcriptional regulator [Gemmobacter serpentinus]|uniref:helix-turn-helix transcriptional regulator n=1 Tax=Gemmobacter serpentinus TaxID=2652247 RepID=UPI00124C46DD